MSGAAEAPPAASGRQIALRSGSLRAVVTEVGASVRCLRSGDAELLDGYGIDEIALYAQGQALVPWPNRLADGRYRFGGRSHQVPLSEPERHNAIHGLARWASWEIVEEHGDRVVLSLQLHPQAGYPFALRIEVEYVLAADEGLTVRTTARNVGAEPLPFGAGFHPYVTVGTATVDTARLRLPAAISLELDDRGIPTGRRLPVQGDNDFRALRPIGSTQLDTTFGDLDRDRDGRARIRLELPDGSRGVTVWLDEAHPYFMAFTGDSLPEPARRRRSLGVEPMTCAPNALQSGDGLRTLAPGESFSASWGIAM